MSQQSRAIISVIMVVIFVGSTIGLVFTLSAKQPVASQDIKLDVDLYVRPEVITGAYKIYGDNSMNWWLANTKIKNTGTTPVRNFKISYKIEGYCDWTSSEIYPLILPGETVRDYCWPTFKSSDMKEISTKTPAELTMRYEYDGIAQPVEKQEKFFFLGKNDFIWTYIKEEDLFTFQDLNDNYPLLAAFVTKNDELTQSVSKTITGGLAPSDDQDTYLALVRTFYALRNAGMKYVYEPAVLEAETFGQYIQYPADTLNRMAGTCMDLAILFCALLEAVSIRTFIFLVPGHAIPAVYLPDSGNILPIESTFMDVEFVHSHYTGVSAEVSADECIEISIEYINKYLKQGKCVIVDIEELWDSGVVPSW